MRQPASIEEVWTHISRELTVPQQIRNWTVFSGYLTKGDFVARWDDDQVVCTLKTSSVIHVPHDDFETVWQIWDAYLRGRFQRHAMTKMTRHSKYIISILHQCLDEG
jgi:hypothetical protein